MLAVCGFCWGLGSVGLGAQGWGSCLPIAQVQARSIGASAGGFWSLENDMIWEFP